jgi:hypothetical protein
VLYGFFVTVASIPPAEIAVHPAHDEVRQALEAAERASQGKSDLPKQE